MILSSFSFVQHASVFAARFVAHVYFGPQPNSGGIRDSLGYAHEIADQVPLFTMLFYPIQQTHRDVASASTLLPDACCVFRTRFHDWITSSDEPRLGRIQIGQSVSRIDLCWLAIKPSSSGRRMHQPTLEPHSQVPYYLS